MTRPFDLSLSTLCEPANSSQRSSHIERYRKPKRVWIDEGHVCVESHDGGIVSMTPEVALELSRLIGEAGAETLVHKVMSEVADRVARLRGSRDS